MKKLAGIIACVAILCAFGACASLEKAGSATGLEGTWALHAADNPEFALTVTFTGNAWEARWGSEEDEDAARGTLSVASNTDPKGLDLMVINHPDAQMVGKSLLGIWKMEDDGLTIAVGEAGSGIRPKVFENDGSSSVLVGKRIEEGKTAPFR